ncbi:MAG: 16S rRNA (cytosine(1402)-N(4))-methyltransferase RsmH [Candidatus Firestonebacteria bacterium]
MKHVSVLLAETIEFLKVRPGGIYLDATLGGGGHTKRILETEKNCRVIALDRDPKAIEIAKENLKEFEGRVSFFNLNFRRMEEALVDMKIDGTLFDLGVSSFQLDDAGRGFSFRESAPLDMRMGGDAKYNAGALVNELSREDLENLIRIFGEENFAGRIARVIVETRKVKRIETTVELAEAISKAVPSFYRRGKIHPATRTFQAIRIAVNDELGALKEGLIKTTASLSFGGRLCVISFHSLEDRIVKEFIKGESTLLPVTKKPLVPGGSETAENRRSRSAKLRVAEKK